MSKTRKRDAAEALPSALTMDAEVFMDRLTVGNWVPNVDICEAADSIVVRVELPGIEPGDMRLTLHGNQLRVQGLKREPAAVRKRISYYCLERRYGKFDRRIPIDWVIDAGRCRASLAAGILTITIPRIAERRGRRFEIPIN